MKTITKIQVIIAIAAFVAAVGFGIAGFMVPPPGQIHESGRVMGTGTWFTLHTEVNPKCWTG